MKKINRNVALHLVKRIKKNVAIALPCLLLFFACNQHAEKIQDPIATTVKDTTLSADAKVQRYGMVTGIKPDKIEYYKKLHANIWPPVAKKIKECNIRNYSIYLKQIDNKYYLFSYFEYVGDNFDKDMQHMAADTATQRWWKETNPTQLPLPEALAQKQTWSRMEEVFYEK
jgi:L-rhamnose mutarotase